MDRTALQTLAANLRALMDASDDLRSQGAVGKRAGINQTNVGHILASKHPPGLSQIEGLAKAFGLQPWQLLVPDLKPKDLPMCVAQSERAAFDRMRVAAEELTKYRA